MGSTHRHADHRSHTRTLIVLLAALSLIATQFAGLGAATANAATVTGTFTSAEMADAMDTNSSNEATECTYVASLIDGYEWDGTSDKEQFSGDNTTETADLDPNDVVIVKAGNDYAYYLSPSDDVFESPSTNGISHITGCGLTETTTPPGDGTLRVSKVVNGNDPEAPATDFDFTILCDDVDESLTLDDGETSSDYTAEGGYTNCVVTEDVSHGADAISWAITGDVTDSGSGDTTDSFDVGEDEDVTVTFTNTFNTSTTSTPQRASLTVVKDVVGPAPDGAEFGFDVQCSDVDRDGFTLEAGASSTTTGIIGGSTCTVAETDDVDADGTSWVVTGDATGSGVGLETDEFTLGAGDSATVTFTNDYAEAAGEVFEPEISLVKTALVEPDDNGDKVVTVDDDGVGEVTYEYTITNTGNVDLLDLTLVDDVIGDLTDDLEVSSLAVGESTTVEVTYTTTEAQLDDGEVVNVATTTGTDAQGTTVTDTDDEMVKLAQVFAEAEEQPEIAETGADATLLTTLGLLLAAVGAFALRMTPSGARRK